MLRYVFVVAVALGLAAPATAAVMVTAPGEYGIMNAPMQDANASITLVKDGFLDITGVLGVGTVNDVTFSGPGGVVAADTFSGGGIPAAFAGTFNLMGGTTYLLSTGSTGISAVAFEVSEVPLPGAVLLLGTAMAGLGLYRRRTAAQSAA